MSETEIRKRYEYARARAISEIDDLSQGAHPANVYDAIEIAMLWRAVCGNRERKFGPETWDVMGRATDRWDA